MSDDGGWKPAEIFGGGNSYESQRLTGEIHIIGIKKPPTTDDLLLHVDGVNVEDELIVLMNEMLDDPEFPMRKQINNYRKNADVQDEPAEEVESGEVESGGDPLVDVEIIDPDGITDVIPKIIDLPPTPMPEQLPDPSDPDSLRGRHFEFKWLGKVWTVLVEHLLDDPNSLFVETAMSDADLSAGKIQIRLNLSHPFMTQQVGEDAETLQSLTRLAIAVGLVTAVAKQIATNDGNTRDPQLLSRIDKILRELAN